MAIDNKELALKVVQQGGQIVPSAFAAETRAWFVLNQKTIMAMCNSDGRKAAMFVSSAFTAINRVPELLECKKSTLWNCILSSMALDLYPGTMQECAYLPFSKEATFVPMYQGVVKLIYRGAFCKSICGHAVHEGDKFRYRRGSRELIEHEIPPGPLANRGKPIGAYVIITNRFGGEHIKYMTEGEIMSFKARSAASKSKYSPWNSEHWSDRRAMWLKTCLKQNAKMFPKNSQISKAFELDDKAEQGNQNSEIPAILTEDVGAVQELLGVTPGPMPNENVVPAADAARGMMSQLETEG